MCLITQFKEPEILEQDLIVYKKLRYYGSSIYTLRSYNLNFPYVLNRLYKTKIKLLEHDKIWQWFDDTAAEAIHKNVYKTPFIFASSYGAQPHQDLICIAEGFHFFFDTKRINKSFYIPIKIVQCTIPAGSTVYKDSTGLGVANQIIINKIIEI